MKSLKFVIFLSIFALPIEEVLTDRFNPCRPNNIVLLSYHMEFEPHLENNTSTYQADGSINFILLQPTPYLTICASKISKFHYNFYIRFSDMRELEPIHIFWDEHTDGVHLIFNETLEAGEKELVWGWKGDLSPYSGIMYEVHYVSKDEQKQKTTLCSAASIFVPLQPGTLYPIWNYPEVKVRMSIYFTHLKNQKLISNIPDAFELEHGEENKVRTGFERSSPESRFLSIFILLPDADLNAVNGDITFFVSEEKLEETFNSNMCEEYVSDSENDNDFRPSLSQELINNLPMGEQYWNSDDYKEILMISVLPAESGEDHAER